jgi:hypothetical protein
MYSVRQGLRSIVRRKLLWNPSVQCYATKPDADATTHFGFRTVPEDTKEEMGSAHQKGHSGNISLLMYSPQ